VNLVADAVDQAAREAEEALKPTRKLLADLMQSEALAAGDFDHAIQQVTETAARALRVERASVWSLAGTKGQDGRIECVDQYLRSSDAHSTGVAIAESAAPSYFAALATERSIVAHDAMLDPRTREFADGYLRPNRITAMVDTPVFVRGKMVALVCLEHTETARRWHFWEELIAGTCADFVALVLEARGWAMAERALREERDALECKVKERTAALQASEEGLRALLSVTPIALVVTALDDHRVLFANARADSLFEAAEDTPRIGLDAAPLFSDPEQRERFTSALGASVDGVEVQLRTLRGREFWGRVSTHRVTYGGRDALLASIDDITPLKQVEERLREMATRDALTGAHNRRSLIEIGVNELERARRYQRAFCAAMIDVDHFKRVNDTHGHAVGDEVLRALVQTTSDLLRGSDLLGRWGGEEFVVLLPETDLGAANLVLGRVREKIAKTPVTAKGIDPVAVTISIGIAEWTGIEALEHLVERADEACYAAKRAGRNRVVTANPR
jgi:diguanylate cyclase (GGDEF)-like protein/PAS domain S-box-containing protein